MMRRNWSPGQIAKLFGVHRDTVGEWLDAKMLPYNLLPYSGYRRVETDLLIEFCRKMQREDLIQDVLAAQTKS